MIKRNYKNLKKDIKDYKRYTNLLGSDVASLKVESGMVVYTINFGEDGTYKVYTIKDYTDNEVPAYYAKLDIFKNSIKLIDDDDFIEFTAETIEVYKAGLSILVNLKGIKNE
jgi:hypothetical protein